jgi:hypothetical protein
MSRSSARALLALLPCLAAPALAATLRVGPGQAITRLADAARVARDGDTVLVMPGEYRGDVAVWLQRSLTIRGVGARPVLVADGRSAEGKAIWVIRDGDFSIDNIEFRGARVPAGNGAAIRFERGRLRIGNCAFVDNQTGILTGNVEDTELAIEDSLFADAPRQTHSLPHLLYAGRIARLSVTGSRFHNGYRGHLLKSRARISDLRYNLIVDGPQGAASYEADFPDGGDVTLVGNVIGQSAATENRTLVAFGAERRPWAVNRLTMIHNTLISDDDRPAQFARVWEDRLPAGTAVLTRNNLAVGAGTLASGLPGDHGGNLDLPPGALPRAAELDFSPPRHIVESAAPATLSRDLQPTAEFALPMGIRPLTPPQRWAPGAFQQ